MRRAGDRGTAVRRCSAPAAIAPDAPPVPGRGGSRVDAMPHAVRSFDRRPQQLLGHTLDPHRLHLPSPPDLPAYVRPPTRPGPCYVVPACGAAGAPVRAVLAARALRSDQVLPPLRTRASALRGAGSRGGPRTPAAALRAPQGALSGCHSKHGARCRTSGSRAPRARGSSHPPYDTSTRSTASDLAPEFAAGSSGLLIAYRRGCALPVGRRTAHGERLRVKGGRRPPRSGAQRP